MGELSELFTVMQTAAQGTAKSGKALLRKLNEESE